MSISSEFANFELIGRRIGSSKFKYSWGVKVNSRLHIVTLTVSKCSSIFRLFFDEDKLCEVQDFSNLVHAFSFLCGAHLFSLKNSLPEKETYVLTVDSVVFPQIPGRKQHKRFGLCGSASKNCEEKAEALSGSTRSFVDSFASQNSSFRAENVAPIRGQQPDSSQPIQPLFFPEPQMVESIIRLSSENNGVELFAFGGGRYPQEPSDSARPDLPPSKAALQASLIYRRTSTLFADLGEMNITRLRTITNDQANSKLMRSLYA